MPELLRVHSLKEQVLVRRGTATKKTNNSKPGNEERDDEEDHKKGEEHFDD